MYLTGFHAIEERIRSGKSGTGPLLVAKAGPRARELVALAQAAKIRIDRVGTFDLDRINSGHRGIALQVEGGGENPAETNLESFLQALEDDAPAHAEASALVLVLDEVTDPHNYGAILRSAEQFGVDLVLSRRRRTAKHAEIIAQTSAGASEWVPQAEEPNLDRALDLLKEAGFWIYGADMAGKDVSTLNLQGRTALVLGGEAGLSRLLRQRCDALAAIPTSPKQEGSGVDSLNVSVAAGILLYEARRQGR
jgi:23S rRNA (guanosine2251-2'-O)-methyltransferase